MKKRFTRAIAMLMCVMTAVAFMPALAFAADSSVDVKITVSDKGKLAKDNSGYSVAAKDISVTDKDKDGSITLNDAFITAHEKFNSNDGYALSGGYCTKFWGDTSGNFLGFVNGQAGYNTWDNTAIKSGDYIVVSINSDYMGNDYYTSFDKNSITVKPGEAVSLKLTGHNGMAGGEDRAIKDMTVKTSAGTVLGTTDENGDISVKFSKAGKYNVTVEAGNVETVIADGYLFTASKTDKDGNAIYATSDWDTGKEAIVYYTTDPGTAPYDASLMYHYSTISVDEFDPETFDGGYLLYSNEYKTNAPVIAPACVITVKTPVVKPTKPSFKLTAGKGSVTVKMSAKPAKYKADGFQMYYKRTAASKWNKVSTKLTSKTIKKLRKNTKYSVKVRTYKKIDGKYYYSSYTSIKRIRTKR